MFEADDQNSPEEGRVAELVAQALRVAFTAGCECVLLAPGVWVVFRQEQQREFCAAGEVHMALQKVVKNFFPVRFFDFNGDTRAVVGEHKIRLLTQAVAQG